MPENRGPVTLLRVRNNRDVLIDFILEPLGESHPMPPGTLFELVADREFSEYPDVRIEHDRLVVYCDPRVGLYRDGKPVGGPV
jgi:hypothetical protein